MTFPPSEFEDRARPGWTRARVVFLLVSALGALGVAWWAADVLLPFVLATIVAYVLTPLVAFCERYRVPRSAAIVLVYCATISTLYGVVAMLAPRIYHETVQLSRETPAIARDLAARWGPTVEQRLRAFTDRAEPTAEDQPERPAIEVLPLPNGGYGVHLGQAVEIVQDGPKTWRVREQRQSDGFSVASLFSAGVDETLDYLRQNALELLHFGQVIVRKVTRGVFFTIMTLMVAGYLMHTRDDIVEFFRSLPPPRARPAFDRLLHRMDRGLSGVVRGQLVICGVNGVLSAIGFALFGLKYWPVLAVVAAVLSIIPIFGSILSTVPAVLIGLTQDFWTALWVLLWIIGIHQIEANLLNPKIIGVAAKLHPVMVVFVLILGEHYYGLWGALLAVPALSAAQSIFSHFRFESMPDLPPDSIAVPRGMGARAAVESTPPRD